MKNTLSMGLAGLVLCALAVTTKAFAEIVTLPLNCAGRYDVNTPYWTSDFDLGVTFSEISHVYIDWSGEITGMLAVDYSGEPPYIPVPGDGGLSSYIGSYPRRIAEVGGGGVTYPAPDPFNLQSEFWFSVEPGTWDDLFDGKEDITIYRPIPVTIPEIEIIDYGLTVIDNATLVVDGTIIPEPTTFVLLGLGLAKILTEKHIVTRA
jgi:hypothetical protein